MPLEPVTTRAAITQEAVSHIGDITSAMCARGLEAHDVARFLDRVVFALFAEAEDLLPEKIFTRLLKNSADSPEIFARLAGELFLAMARGGFWGIDLIRRFNGGFFTDGPILTPTRDELKKLRKAAKLDWSAVDLSVFGALFERGVGSGHSDSDEEILERLLALNLERAGEETPVS